MAPRRRRLPSFCKILLDRPAPQLPLPPDFVRKHLENNIPEDPTLLSANGGYSWRLKIRKDGDYYCFADGWRDVVEDSLLECGDFLVFWLVDESTFKLSVFSPSGCEKMFPSKSEDEEDDHVEEEDEVAQMNEQVKQEEELGDEDEEEEEDDDEEEQEQEAEDEDFDEEEEEEEEEEDDDVYEDGGRGGGEEEDVDDEEDDDGGGDIDGNDGDPYFTRIISASHTSPMRLPLGFARLAGLDRERSIRMKNLDGEEWSMSLRSERSDYTRYYLSAGWLEFKRVNHLNEGDKCVIKFIRSEDKLYLAKVTKKRVPGKPPAVKVPATENVAEPVKKRGRGKRPASEAPAAEVLKRTRRQPPRVQGGTEDDGREVVKKGPGRRPATRASAAEVMRRTRGKRRRVEVESIDDRREVVKRKTRGKQETGKAPVTEILKRLRERPPRVEENLQSKKPAGRAPVAEILKRKRGRPRVEVERKNDDAKVVKRGRPSRVEVVSENDGEKVVKRPRGRPPAKVK